MIINVKTVCCAAAKVVAVIVLMFLAFGVGKLCRDIEYQNKGYKDGYQKGHEAALREWSRILNGNKEVKNDRMKQ